MTQAIRYEILLKMLLPKDSALCPVILRNGHNTQVLLMQNGLLTVHLYCRKIFLWLIGTVLILPFNCHI